MAVALSLGALVFMAFLLRSMPRPQVFSGWESIIVAWRDTRDVFEKLLLIFVLSRQFSRSLAITLAVATIGAAASIGTSLCGINPESMKVIRDTINDVLRWLRGETVRSSSAGSIES